MHFIDLCIYKTKCVSPYLLYINLINKQSKSFNFICQKTFTNEISFTFNSIEGWNRNVKFIFLVNSTNSNEESN